MEQQFLCDCTTKCAGLPQRVSRATYFRHAKYRAPKAVFDKSLTTLIQSNSSTTSVSVRLNDTDVQLMRDPTPVKRRRVEEAADRSVNGSLHFKVRCINIFEGFDILT